MQVRTKTDMTQPFHIYFDIDVINNDQKNGEPTPSLKFNLSRNSPFIDCPQNYYVSIIRFQLQTPSLPVFIPQVKIGQTDRNRTIYEFTIYDSVSGNHFTKYVTYRPSNTTAPLPAVPLNFQDLSNEYYFVYTIQDWILMLNECLSVLVHFAALEPPFFYFDVQTSLLKLYMPTSWMTSNYNLYVNKQLQTLLDSFQFKLETVPFQMTSLYKFTVNPILLYGKNTETINNVQYNVLLQESNTLPILNPVKSIVFTTGLFPIQNSLTSPPQLFGADSSLFNGGGNNSNIIPMITDFEVNPTNASTYKESVQYIPSGPYRLIDLFGSSPVSTLEIVVYWKDQFGNLHPFKLNSGCSCDIKIMFRRKDYGNVKL